ncbi:MAG: ABC transporter permease [Oscillospiraceae bacterium]|nr:ABC transporter permease [Oscillospiraceae bacterium]
MKPSSMKYLVTLGVRSIFSHSLMSFASFCVMLVSLLLVGSSILFSININDMVAAIENQNEIIVYLEDDIDDVSIGNVAAELEKIDNIDKKNITFFSKEKALENYRETYAEYVQIFDSLDENPLPDTYRVKVDDIDLITQTVEKINTIDNIYKVSAPFEFANILTETEHIMKIISGMMIFALVIVSMVIISNTTRASAQMRMNEITIMKYVGATNVFINIPFFIEGLLIGAFAGLVSAVITGFIYDGLISAISQEMYVWNILGVTGFIDFDDIRMLVYGAYIIGGALIAALGSVISVRKYVRV